MTAFLFKEYNMCLLSCCNGGSAGVAEGDELDLFGRYTQA